MNFFAAQSPKQYNHKDKLLACKKRPIQKPPIDGLFVKKLLRLSLDRYQVVVESKRNQETQEFKYFAQFDEQRN